MSLLTLFTIRGGRKSPPCGISIYISEKSADYSPSVKGVSYELMIYKYIIYEEKSDMPGSTFERNVFEGPRNYKGGGLKEPPSKKYFQMDKIALIWSYFCRYNLILL